MKAQQNPRAEAEWLKKQLEKTVSSIYSSSEPKQQSMLIFAAACVA
jgi:hypothetical protein